MAQCYSFAVARLAAHPCRDERLNVGLIIFHGNQLDIRPARNLEKVHALSGALEIDALRSAILRLEQLDGLIQREGKIEPLDRVAALQTISPLELSDLGTFEARSSAAYEQAVAEVLAQLVEPEPAPVRKAIRRSRLLSSLKAAFKSERVLARKGEDLSAHRVVPGWQLAEGLSADLVLKNGAMHVIETVDAQAEDLSVRKMVSDIAVSALVLEQARMTFGEKTTHSKLVYLASAMNENMARPSLQAAEHQGTQLVNWASDDDRLRLIAEISSLAVPFEAKAGKRNIGVNASTQEKLTLN